MQSLQLESSLLRFQKCLRLPELAYFCMRETVTDDYQLHIIIYLTYTNNE